MSKKILAVFLAVNFIFCSCFDVFAVEQYSLGDVDGNGNVEVNDAVLVLQWVLDKGNYLSEEAIKAADVFNYNNADEITALNASYILQMAINNFGEETTESTEESTSESSTESTEESTSESSTESTEESTSESSTESTEESTSESSTESTEESTSESATVNETKSWNFSNSDFSEKVGTLSSKLVVGDITVFASSSKTVKISELENSYGDENYQYCVDLGGSGSTEFRSISFDVKGDCEINVYAVGRDRVMQLATAERELATAEKFTSEISMRSFSYSGGKNTVFLYSTSGGIKVYKIDVIYKNSFTEETSTEATSTEGTSETETTTEKIKESESESMSIEDITETETSNVGADDSQRFEKVENLISYLMENNVDSNGNVTFTDISWNIEKKGKNIWHYASGCMIKAFTEIYERTKDKKYYDFAKKHMDFFINDDGEIIYFSKNSTSSKYSPTESGYKLDDINAGKPLFYFYEKTSDKRYKNAIELLETQLENQPRTSQKVLGNFWHKKSYPQQIWLDGLYMAQPFYMEYGNKFGTVDEESGKVKECVDSYNQFMNVYKTLRNSETGLYYHGYDDSKSLSWANSETGLSENYWLRAMGWFAMSLVDTAEKMPENMAEEKKELIKIYKEFADAMIKYQDEKTGMWYQVVDKGGSDGNYLETSGTLAVSYSLMKASRLGFVDESYFDYGKKAFDGVCDNYLTETDGKVVLSNICLVAGLGGTSSSGSYKNRDGSYEYYIGEKVEKNDAKGLGPLLFAYNEVRMH